jgi:hypothetical protein
MKWNEIKAEENDVGLYLYRPSCSKMSLYISGSIRQDNQLLSTLYTYLQHTAFTPFCSRFYNCLQHFNHCFVSLHCWYLFPITSYSEKIQKLSLEEDSILSSCLYSRHLSYRLYWTQDKTQANNMVPSTVGSDKLINASEPFCQDKAFISEKMNTNQLLDYSCWKIVHSPWKERSTPNTDPNLYYLCYCCYTR